MKTPCVGIVILNYKTYNLTIECVKKLSKLTYKNFFIVIIDNNSSNESSKILKQKYTMPNSFLFKTYFIASNKNGGYSYGNNLGIRKAKELGAEYVVVMNNDVEIVDKNIIEKMLEIMDSRKNVAVVGPGIIENNLLQLPAYKYRPTGISLTATNLFFPIFILINKIMRITYQSKPKLSKVYSVAGCCLMIKLEPFKEVGYFDENVFLYGEELILGEKFYMNNYNIYHLPEVKVIHAHSYTINNSLKNIQKLRLMENSFLYYINAYRQDIRPWFKLMIKWSGYIKIKIYMPLINNMKSIKYFFNK